MSTTRSYIEGLAYGRLQDCERLPEETLLRKKFFHSMLDASDKYVDSSSIFFHRNNNLSDSRGSDTSVASCEINRILY